MSNSMAMTTIRSPVMAMTPIGSQGSTMKTIESP